MFNLISQGKISEPPVNFLRPTGLTEGWQDTSAHSHEGIDTQFFDAQRHGYPVL